MVRKIRRIISILLTLCILMSVFAVGSFSTQAATSASGVDYGLVDNVQYGNILHCWNWSYNSIRRNLGKIAEQGFSAVQVSPTQTIKESINESWSTVNNQWWIVYQPLGFNIENSGKGLGSVDELKALCEDAHRYNIKVIVDVVFNHLANDYGHEGTIHPHVSEEFRNNMDLWHQPLNYQISNYNDRYDITHHSLSALPDLNTGHDTVQWYSASYLKELIYCGVDGFRFDAAKHIETPSDAGGTRSEFWYNVLGTATSYAQSTRGITPFYYGEMLDNTGGVDITAYTYYMSVTDNGASRNVRDGVLYGDSGKAAQSYSSNGAAPDKTVLWNESHDEYIGTSNYTRGIDSWHMNKVWGMVGSRNQNAGLYLARPYDPGTTRIGEADATAWTSTEVKAINQFKNRFAGQSEYLAAYGSFAYNVRGNAGAAIVNTGQGNSSAYVKIPSNGMAEGLYKDQITGNDFTVSGGWLSGQMGSSGIAVVYSKGPGVSVSPSTTAYRTNKLTITLHTQQADYGLYSFDGKNYTKFTDGQQITIGADKAVGETTNVYVQSVNMWGEYSSLECYYYWKLASDQKQDLYFDNGRNGFSDAHAYFYHSETGEVYADWPGVKMSIDENTDMPYVAVPKGYECSNVIINNGSNNGQSPSSGEGYKLNGETALISNNYVWPYTPVTTEGLKGDLYLRTNNWGSDGAVLMAYVWTGSNNGMATFEPVGNGVYKATLPNGVWKRVNFLRINGSAPAEDIWSNVWNQASHMIPTGQNFFSMYNDSWDGSGVWGVYDDSLADSSVTLTGDFNDWSLDTKMTQNSGGIYKTTVKIDQGSYKFKVVQYGLWYGSNEIIDDKTSSAIDLSTGYGECTLQASGGDYTFTYDSYTKTLSVSFVADPNKVEPEAGTASAVTIAGDFNGWDSTNSTLAYTTDSSVVSKTIDLTAGTYSFKIVKGGLWYGSGSTIKDTASGLALSSSAGDVVLEASGGKYTFSFSLKTYNLTITAEISATPGVTTRPAMSIAGDFNEWSTTASKLAYISDTVVTKTLNIEKGTYYFKIVDTDAGLWYGSGSTIKDKTSSTTLSATAAECILQATGGTYTFKYNISTKVLTVDFVAAAGPSSGEVSTASIAGDFNGWDYSADKLVHTSATVATKTMTLEKGTYQFKIVDGGLWYGNGGTIEDTTTTTSDVGWVMEMTAGNCTLKAKGGEYTFTYDLSTRALIIEYVADETSEPSVGEVSTASIAGDFNGWDFKADKMTYTSANVVSTTISLSKGTYQFKVVDDGLWYGNEGTIKDTANGWIMEMTAGNCTLKATGGEYTFKYNISTRALTITSVISETSGPVEGDVSTASIAGDFNSWNITANKLTHTSADVAKTTITLDKGMYYFKIVDEGLWYGNNGTIENTTTATSSVGWEMSVSQNECVLNATGGDYTFSFNLKTKMLVVEYKAASVVVGTKSDIALSGSFNSWSTSSDKMTYASAKTVKTTVKLSAGSYEFKVVDGLWYGSTKTISDKTTDLELSGTAGNVILQASGGDYTFVYNFIDHKLTITFVKSAGPSIGSKSDIIVAGDFNGWETSGDMMTYASDNTVTKSIELAKGKYLFKLVNTATGLWYGNDGTIKDTTTVTSSVGWTMDATAGNCELDASGGTYTFTYNLTTNALTVTYVAGTTSVPAVGSASAFSVAGEFNGWSSSENVLKYKSDKVVTTTLELSAGSYSFKIVDTEGGLWYGNEGSIADTTTVTSSVGWEMSSAAGDCKLVASGGTYTFEYNITTNMLAVTFVAGSGGDEEVLSSVALAGDFNNWDTSADYMIVESGNVVTITKTLSAGTYGFKIVDEGLWYGNNGTIEDTTTTTSAVGWEMQTGTGNCTLKATGGKYTFRYNRTTRMLVIRHG